MQSGRVMRVRKNNQVLGYAVFIHTVYVHCMYSTTTTYKFSTDCNKYFCTFNWHHGYVHVHLLKTKSCVLMANRTLIKFKHV